MQQGNESGNSGIVFNIQKFSVHDGPGIRTIIFLKGCPLNCKWCANPEGIHCYPEVLLNKNHCIGTTECRSCLSACKLGAIKEVMGKTEILRDVCTNCGECAKVCPAKALEQFGIPMTVDEVLNIVEEDSAFYSRSGGGITLSGGEPLQQVNFVYDLLKEAKSRGLDTAIETSGFTEWENLEKVCKVVNTIHYDIKCMDSQKHRQYTGVSNEKILKNFKMLIEKFPKTPIIVRTPVIPSFNDTKEDIVAIADYISGNNLVQYELLPYHRFGENKYSFLGREYPLSEVPTLEKEQFQQLVEVINIDKNY